VGIDGGGDEGVDGDLFAPDFIVTSKKSETARDRRAVLLQTFHEGMVK
jgi:hypothetical protein